MRENSGENRTTRKSWKRNFGFRDVVKLQKVKSSCFVVSCGSTRPFAHGKVRLYPWAVCVLSVTPIPTVKVPMGNHYGYLKKNKRITHNVSRTKS